MTAPSPDQLAALADAANEAFITYCGKQVELFHALSQTNEACHFSACGEREYWRIQMEEAIKARSEDQVRRMEEERGLQG